MRQPGRPRALDDTKREIICAIFASGGTLDGAARYVGCSRRTIHREAHRNSQFREDLSKAEAQGAVMPFQVIREASCKNWRAAAWLLERAYPERYGRSQIGDHRAKRTNSIGVIHDMLATKLRTLIERQRYGWRKPATETPPADRNCQQ